MTIELTSKQFKKVSDNLSYIGDSLISLDKFLQKIMDDMVKAKIYSQSLTLACSTTRLCIGKNLDSLNDTLHILTEAGYKAIDTTTSNGIQVKGDQNDQQGTGRESD